SPQSFPQPPEIVPAENELTQPPVSDDNPNEPLDNDSPIAAPPVLTPTAPTNTAQQINDNSSLATPPKQNRRFSESPNSSMQKNMIHSVRLETD
ncbi:MAG: hypothetical protein IKS45_06880, partial [Thermoguttaceae bacterium]|nr:hypothetical protein [Thermoguttaceae bacterium]